MAGEFDFVDWLRTQQPASELVPVPAGDDLAVVNWPENDLLLVGADQVLDGIHFDSRVHPPRLIGRKVMNRNLSDCAAMACLPVAAVATVALPKGTGLDYAKELYLGLKEAADVFYCKIVGGDTATWPNLLAITVTILGRAAGVRPLTRGGAKAGEGLYVSGPLGGSLLGRHMTFEPRIHLARQLAKGGHVTAMIDVSDGLSRDLRHLCQHSRLGAVIDADAVPVHPDAVRMSRQDGRSPLDHALHDGEDHELLFTATALPQAGIRVGTMTAASDIVLRQAGEQRPLEPRGWEHNL